MSKELIERALHSFADDVADRVLISDMADRIEELEREVERLNRIKSRTRQVELQAERDALFVDNARLREAINRQPYTMDREVCEALSATPEQSLARIRNQVREDIAREFDGEVWAYDYREIAARIRAMKELE